MSDIDPTFNLSWRTRMPREYDPYDDPVDPEHEEFLGELMNEIDQGRWDDDPSPYDGTYSEE